MCRQDSGLQIPPLETFLPLKPSLHSSWPPFFPGALPPTYPFNTSSTTPSLHHREAAIPGEVAAGAATSHTHTYTHVCIIYITFLRFLQLTHTHTRRLQVSTSVALAHQHRRLRTQTHTHTHRHTHAYMYAYTHTHTHTPLLTRCHTQGRQFGFRSGGDQGRAGNKIRDC